jgi:hypothetical protein
MGLKLVRQLVCKESFSYISWVGWDEMAPQLTTLYVLSMLPITIRYMKPKADSTSVQNSLTQNT